MKTTKELCCSTVHVGRQKASQKALPDINPSTGDKSFGVRVIQQLAGSEITSEISHPQGNWMQMAVSGDLPKGTRVKSTMHRSSAAPGKPQVRTQKTGEIGNCFCKERKGRQTHHTVSPFFGLAVFNPYLRAGESKTDFPSRGEKKKKKKKSWRKRSETTWG